MYKRNKISDYSPLFGEDLRLKSESRILTRQENGQNVSFIRIRGVEVRGSRQALEKVVQGLLRNGGSESIFTNKSYIHYGSKR